MNSADFKYVLLLTSLVLLNDFQKPIVYLHNIIACHITVMLYHTFEHALYLHFTYQILVIPIVST